MAGVPLGGLGLIAGGLVLVYAGVQDPEGGPIGVVRSLLKGESPTPGVQKRTSIGATGYALGHATGSIVGSAARLAIMNVAQSYLGVPYRFAGASRSGMDCSGLVLVAYRDGAGVQLPHLATAQAAMATKIDRSQAQAADLAAWGVPGNYPHIALVVNQTTCIAAPTWGKVVQYQPLWEKKVSGYGYPDFYRLLPE